MRLKERLIIFLGNTFEHYDTALYSLFTPLFATYFFPFNNHMQSLLFAYCVLPLSMLARPLGALYWGYFAEKYGKQKALSRSMIGCAFITIAFACLPSYEQCGFIAPLLLIVFRFIQCFYTSAEYAIGSFYLIQHTAQDKHDQQSAYMGATSVIGSLFALFAYDMHNVFYLPQPFWRVLFLLGGVTYIFGWNIRRQYCIHSGKMAVVNFRELLQMYKDRSQVIIITALILASGFSYTCYVFSISFLNSILPECRKQSFSTQLYITKYLLMYDVVLLCIMGYILKYMSRTYCMIFSAIIFACTAIVMLSHIKFYSNNEIYLFRFLLVTCGVSFSAPLQSWAYSYLPKYGKTFHFALAYSIGTQCIGSTIAPISIWLFTITEDLSYASLGVVSIALATSYFLYRSQQLRFVHKAHSK